MLRPDLAKDAISTAAPSQVHMWFSTPNTGQFDGPTLFSFIMITLVELGVVFWVGTQLWRTFVLQLAEGENLEQQIIDQRAEQRFEHIFSIPVLLGLLLANIGVLVGQGLSITGGRWDQVFMPAILGKLFSNGQFGTYWTLREIVVILAVAFSVYLLFSKQRPRFIDSATPWINLLLGLALLMAIVLSGNAATVHGNILVFAVLADLLHLLAASLWIGGMLYISTIYLPVLKQSSSIEQTRSLLETLPRFLPLAISGVIILSVTGPFDAAVHMNSFAQLLTTAYGRALVVKVLLVGCMLLTSAIHAGLLRPRLAKDYQKYSALRQKNEDDQSVNTSTQEINLRERLLAKQTMRLSNVLRWEPLLGVGVLVCTGLMTVFAGTLQPPAPPPQSQQPVAPSKPFTTTAKTIDGLFTVKLNVTPNSSGPNTFTVTVLDSKGTLDTGVGVSLSTTMLDMDMGTDTVKLQPDGKGNFSSSGDLSMGGHWQIRIQIRTPDNTLHEASVKFFTPF